MVDELQIQTNILLGKAERGKWSGAYATSDESSRGKESGQLFFLVGLSAPAGFDSKMAGDLLVESVQDTYYEGTEGKKIIAKLEKSIMAAAKRLEFLLQREKIASEKGIDLEIVAAVVKDGFIYMAVLGEGGILLYRNDSLIDLTQGLKDLSGRDLIQSGSGKFAEDDAFLLLSPSATLAISEKEMRQAVKKKSFSALEERAGKDSLLAAVAIHISSEQEEEMDSAAAGLQVKKADEVDDASPPERVSETDDDLPEEDELEDYRITEPESKAEAGQERQTVDDGDEPEEPGTEEKEDGGGVKAKLKEKMESVKGLQDKVRDHFKEQKTYQVILLKIRDFLLQLFELAKKYIWEGLMGMGGGGMYIKGKGPKRSIRGIIILIVLVVSLLYISIRAVNRHQERTDQKGDVETVIATVDEQFHNGRNLGEAGDIAEAVSIIEQAIESLESAKQYGVMEEELDAKVEEGIQLLDEIRGVIVLTDENIITDIAGYIEGAGAADMQVRNDTVYVIDDQTGAVYAISTNGGDVSRVVGEDSIASNPVAFTFDSEGNSLLYDQDNGLLKLYPGEGRIEEVIGLSAASVGTVVEIDNYITPDGSDILYLLRPENQAVSKVVQYPSGYSLPSLRLANSQFSSGKDIEIDGRIYILTDEGVIRYFGDTQDPFTITGLDKPIDGSSCFELDDKLLFLGDSTNQRVVVVTKGSNLAPQQGKYVVQFVYRGDGEYFNDIREVYVDDSDRNMYILAGTKIFKVALFEVDEKAEDLL